MNSPYNMHNYLIKARSTYIRYTANSCISQISCNSWLGWSLSFSDWTDPVQARYSVSLQSLSGYLEGLQPCCQLSRMRVGASGNCPRELFATKSARHLVWSLALLMLSSNHGLRTQHHWNFQRT
jgi:hypothetical protein